MIVSDSDWQLPEDLRAMLPRRSDVAEAGVPAPAPAMPEVAEPRPPWLDHPWLLDHWADKGMRPRVGRARTVAPSSDSEGELSAESDMNWECLRSDGLAREATRARSGRWP